MEYPYEEGVWREPLIVLIDGNVDSAASEFAAVLQDNHAAVIIGEPSLGGCGHTNGGTPTVLAHSKAIFEVPDCARYRIDRTNEMRGIEPDVLVGFLPGEGPHLRMTRFLAKLPEALARTTAVRRQMIRPDPHSSRLRAIMKVAISHALRMPTIRRTTSATASASKVHATFSSNAAAAIAA